MFKPLVALIALLFSLMPQVVEANIYRIGIDDGLPNTTIFAILQDKQGFIWLGTTDSGLLRYDGYQFIQVPVLDMQHAADEDFTDVGVLLLDNQQNLWAGTWGQGVSRLAADGSSLTRFLSDGFQVQSILQAEDGAIWVGTTSGLFRIDQADQIEQVGASDSAVPLLHQRVWSMAAGQNGEIWIGTSQGVHRWSPTDGLDAGRLLFPEATSAGRQNETRALYYNKSQLWVGSRTGLLVFDTDSWQREVFAVPGEGEYDFPPILNTMYAISDDTLLLGSYEGLFQFDLTSKSYQLFREQSALLPSLNIHSVLLDQSGVLWMGTRDGGLYHTRFARSAFSDIALNSLREWQRRYELSVSSIDASHPDALWFGTSERLYRLEHASGAIRSFETSARVNRILTSHDGITYIATDAGLFRYQPEQDVLEPYLTPFASFAAKPIIRDMLLLPDGSFWFGLWGQGVLYYQSSSGKSRHFMQDFQQQRANEVVQVLQAMPDGRVWAGTRYGGLYLLDATEGVMQHVSVSNNSWLPSNTIQCLGQDNQHRLIICTNRGTLLWHQPSDTHKVLYASDGLASDHMHGTLHLDDRTWLLSAQGLSLITPELEQIVTFTRKDGLTATEINAGAISAAPDGTLYLGTLTGISKVEPGQIWVNQHIPTPIVTAYRLNHGEVVPLHFAEEQPAIQLYPGQNSLELQFSAMDFHDVGRNRYRYRLQGFDEQWVYAAERSSAFYANLAPGRYQFQLMAINSHGLMSPVVDAMLIEVLPRWWQKTWYQLLLIALVLLLGFGLHWYRLQHIREMNRLLRQSVDEKAQAQQLLESKVTERTKALEQSSTALSLRSRQLEKSMQQLSRSNARLAELNQLKDEFISTVSHELRTPLTSIRGALALIDSQVISPEQDGYQELVKTALQNSERLSALINDLLDVQKFEAGKLSLNKQKLSLSLLIEQAIQGIAEYGSRYQVAIRLEPYEGDYEIHADELRLRQVMDNLLSNAIKFSPAESCVQVRVERKEHLVRVWVIDQGKGIAESFQKRVFEKFSQADASDSKLVQGTGLGLVICKNIIEGHGGRIGFFSKLDSGSQFWFELPATQRE
ncbi:two-component regulator propeller domain-containing protein [Alkalimonas mucilaginosa]|uniref:histidine kinase n=1 Tax=Alkalimonas mucilaginosa TaxID=3057676 RepID=A0ABU7JKP2_9GAMM|nr:two-component regulator propeller domain-containing protein [Alkalimonas sp. MEB004]MEE2026001.1 two-component regulator propeller domain-containing protein [Alkalimonas sp. MEB004]